MVGGCSYFLHIRHAVAAIRAGQAQVVVIAHGESGRSHVGSPGWARAPSSMTGQFEHPYGALAPYASFTLPVVAYLDKYGLGEADLAEIPVASRAGPARNPRAFRPKLLSVDDVLASPLIAWPFHQLECCPVNDGGGALVLTSRERAADMDLSHRPVTVIGSGESCEGPGPLFMEDLTSFRGFRDASAEAMRTAGIAHADVDHLMIYDAFAHLPIYGLEDMGFVGRGEAVDFIRGGATSPGGSLPTNTNGGGILYAHTGMYGMFALLKRCASCGAKPRRSSTVRRLAWPRRRRHVQRGRRCGVPRRLSVRRAQAARPLRGWEAAGTGTATRRSRSSAP